MAESCRDRREKSPVVNGKISECTACCLPHWESCDGAREYPFDGGCSVCFFNSWLWFHGFAEFEHFLIVESRNLDNEDSPRYEDIRAEFHHLVLMMKDVEAPIRKFGNTASRSRFGEY